MEAICFDPDNESIINLVALLNKWNDPAFKEYGLPNVSIYIDINN